MDTNLTLLLGTAASIGFVHTLLGPDHYLPFVVMSKAREWSRLKTIIITIICGIGHVFGSVVLGLLGVGLGWAVGSMQLVESMRGELAAWGLIAFGLTYGAWGVWRAIKRKPHTHLHVHGDGTIHDHQHGHAAEHAHVHDQPGKVSITPWVLFTVFVLGPCEPLIPLLMVPAAEHSWWGLIMVTTVFGLITITTMTAMTLGLVAGINLIPLGKLERWSHALAGFAILVSGAAIRFLGL